MSNIGQSERTTQNRILSLFRDELNYRYLGDFGDWTERANNSNIEEGLLGAWLEKKAITTILSDMDVEIDALEEKLEKSRRVKHGMIQELLIGRIRLV